MIRSRSFRWLRDPPDRISSRRITEITFSLNTKINTHHIPFFENATRRRNTMDNFIINGKHNNKLERAVLRNLKNAGVTWHSRAIDSACSPILAVDAPGRIMSPKLSRNPRTTWFAFHIFSNSDRVLRIIAIKQARHIPHSAATPTTQFGPMLP